jgi:hypothetical protein
MMIVDGSPNGRCPWYRRTERRTRAAKEIELEVRRRERQRARRHAGLGERDHALYLAVVPQAVQPDQPSYR